VHRSMSETPFFAEEPPYFWLLDSIFFADLVRESPLCLSVPFPPSSADVCTWHQFDHSHYYFFKYLTYFVKF
jgi:hypothetical protein